jgi:hypothetical protein
VGKTASKTLAALLHGNIVSCYKTHRHRHSMTAKQEYSLKPGSSLAREGTVYVTVLTFTDETTNTSHLHLNSYRTLTKESLFVLGTK